MNLNNVALDMNTRFMPIIGYPMDHSSVSYVYNTLFQLYDINTIMWPVEILPDGLPDFMDAARTIKIEKFTLTTPLKTDIIPLLDEVEEGSRLCNTVNIVKKENGKWMGCSADGMANVTALKNAGVNLEGKRVLMLGAGSISSIVAFELARAGVQEIVILNRTEEKAKIIADMIMTKTGVKTTWGTASAENLDKKAKCADIFIQCTSLGLFGTKGRHEYLGFIEKLKKDAVVYDVVVNPPITEVIQKAMDCGLKTVMGLEMMVSEMGVIFEYCFGIKITKNDYDKCMEVISSHFNLKK